MLCRSPFATKTAHRGMDTPRRYAVVSGMKQSVADPLGPVSCKLGPLWNAVVFPANPAHARLVRDLQILDPMSTS